jgi:MFS transporter, putative metabolite:H+ symporter
MGSTEGIVSLAADKTKQGIEEGDLVALYDKSPLDGRYWASVALSVSATIFEFFDFFVVAFLVSVLAKQWNLTYGQTSVMLLSAGIGAIVGALVWGAWADRAGRKMLLVLGVALCALASGAVSLIPDGAWVLFAALRFIVGFGVGGAAAVGVPLIVEYTPTRHRTIITSAMLVPVGLGILVAALVATLLDRFGWRGLAMLGYLPLVPALLIAWVVPESVRWLVARGRNAEARRIVARALKVSPDTLPRPAGIAASAIAGRAPATRFADLFDQPRLFWLTLITWLASTTTNYGVLLWGPTIIALLMGVSPADAARIFVFVALAGTLGRTIFSVLPQWLGRRRCGEIMGYGVALSLGAAAMFAHDTVAGYPAFVVLLIPAALFFDGGFANLTPYPAEIFPVRLSARGVGLAQAANGVGKIVGPLCLAVIAGTSNLITPKATVEAVTPGFLFLAACGLAVGLAFTFLGVETHRKPLTLEGIDDPQLASSKRLVRQDA